MLAAQYHLVIDRGEGFEKIITDVQSHYLPRLGETIVFLNFPGSSGQARVTHVLHKLDDAHQLVGVDIHARDVVLDVVDELAKWDQS